MPDPDLPLMEVPSTNSLRFSDEIVFVGGITLGLL